MSLHLASDILLYMERVMGGGVALKDKLFIILPKEKIKKNRPNMQIPCLEDSGFRSCKYFLLGKSRLHTSHLHKTD